MQLSFAIDRSNLDLVEAETGVAYLEKAISTIELEVLKKVFEVFYLGGFWELVRFHTEIKSFQHASIEELPEDESVFWLIHEILGNRLYLTFGKVTYNKFTYEDDRHSKYEKSDRCKQLIFS